ncbi:alcohol dehydrogenase catalytic domain-containing protein [Xanthomonas sacchari]|uniref:zinc-binding dehydrogenase n=1 Tax=Xanthomonas sacchari TaxID=56458 RepID=UPI0022578917|nr:alcohol dehydrogenase catalytic domain-containing protein [Xanthomonas sacchari]MCW0447206.1 putative zinc-binding alcohol dehydrogenase [Xanthomonas sacchari]MCW0452918.1 putative zinc-binding alcohol dehydrogenase [Xanthomonas sacchari]UYK77853.1 alcohol dehydrogenase catalytic domain-containing protein [Xanthomonas sacchari]
MRATVLFGAGDVRVENVPDAAILSPTDAVVRVVRACICGSDLWPYQSMAHSQTGIRIGHEAIGTVEAIGKEVRGIKINDFVIMPFAFSDGACTFCHEHMHTSCVNGGFFGMGTADGAQAEAVRVPFADGTLYPLDSHVDEPMLGSLLTLSDVMGTGHHAARVARVAPGKTVAVVGDGAVGLCGVIAAKRLGAERIILLGRHADRIALGIEFGATDVVKAANQEEVIERVRELTGGFGAHSVLECVGHGNAITTAILITRPGGYIGRVGVPQDATMPASLPAFRHNITVGGGPAPVRSYIEELLPDVLEGRIRPGRVFDQATELNGIAEGYRAMQDRRAIKVMISP